MAISPVTNAVALGIASDVPDMSALTVLRVFRINSVSVGYHSILTLSNHTSEQFDSNYVWIGLNNSDGRTLVFEIWDDPDDELLLGPVLNANVTYAVAYVKSGNSHSVLLWSSDGEYDFDEVIATTNGNAPDPILSLWNTAGMGHQVSLTRAWEAALTAAELRVERTSYFPFRTTNLYGNWPLLSRFDLSDWNGTHHWTPAANVLTDLFNVPGPTGVIGEHLVYRQDWQKGNGSIAIPRDANYRSGAWTASGSDTLGANTAETVYCEIVNAENLRIGIGEGPEGQNVLKAFDDPVNGALVLNGFGPLTSPYPSNGWWNATKGRITVSCLFNTDCWDNASYNLIVSLAARIFIDRLRLDFDFETSEFYLAYHPFGSGGNTFEPPLVPVTREETENYWQDFDIRWRCGTVTDNFVSVAENGYITVRWRNRRTGEWVTLFDVQNIALVLNDGLDTKPTGSSQGLGVTPTPGMNNWLRSVWLGFYGLFPTTGLRIYDTDEVSFNTAAIWRTDTGDDDNGEAYHAVIRSKPFTPASSILNWFGIAAGAVMAKAANGVSLVIKAVRDFGVESKTVTANLSAQGAETRVVKRLDDLSFSELTTVQIEVGDTDTPAGRWEVDEIALKPRSEARS